MKKNVLGIMAVICLTGTVAVGQSEQVIDLQDRRELFVDDFLVDSLDQVDQVLHTPKDEGIVLEFDNPWEGRFSGYVTVIREGYHYRLYYRGMPSAGKDGSPQEVTCYAESIDGIHWVKPDLGLITIDGTKENNVILADAAPVTHNFCPFLDTRPDVPEHLRYKALGGTSESGLIGYVSGDGIHWQKYSETPVFSDTGWVFDSQNVCFWSEWEQAYVLYYRKSTERMRSIARATSPDFEHWSDPVQMRYSDTQSTVPSQQLYTNQTHPYFRAPHIYLSIAARFMKGRKVLSEAQAQRVGVHPKYFNDTSDAIFMSTRGGDTFDRTFLQALIRPGIGLQNWVSRSNYPALNVVPTGEHEMSIYVNQDYAQPSAHLRRYSLRLDGFCSLRANIPGGKIITKPFVFSGDHLTLNFATSAAGGIKVEIRDENNDPIPGYSLQECDELIGNEISRTVTWQDKRDLSGLAGQAIRLVFVLEDADLYALQFK